MEAIRPEDLIDAPTQACSRGRGCPHCGEAAGTLPPAVCALLELPLARCGRCGTRATRGDGPPRAVVDCAACDLPCLVETESTAPVCPACRAGRSADLDPGEWPVVGALTSEVRPALDEAWEFVEVAGATAYLDRLSREAARALGAGARPQRTLVFRDPALRSVVLPPEAILISTGALAFVHDEAELMFLLAHEIAHFEHDPGRRLFQLTLRAMIRRGGQPGAETWVQLVHDLLRLGHGDTRELEADARALRVIVELGYDLQAPLRYLARVEDGARAGDPRLTEICLAHPPPRYRAQRLERLVAEEPQPPVPRVNRELFRRALAEPLRSASPRRVHPLAEAAPTPVAPPRPRHAVRWTVITLAAAAAVAAALLLLF